MQEFKVGQIIECIDPEYKKSEEYLWGVSNQRPVFGERYVVHHYNMYNTMFIATLDGELISWSGFLEKYFKAVQEWKLVPKEELKLLKKDDKIRISGEIPEVACCFTHGFYVIGRFFGKRGEFTNLYSYQLDEGLSVYKLTNKTMEIKDMTQPKQFAKVDLKTGMVGVLRNGKKVRILLDTANGDIISGETWAPLDSYNEDLKSKGNSKFDREYDIVKIYQPKTNMDYKDLDYNYHRIWQEPPQKTPEQIEYEKLMSQINDLQIQAEKLKPKN